MNPFRKYAAFSTVETMVAAVILSLLLVLFYSAIGNTLDADHSILLSRGVSASEKWKSSYCSEQEESVSFTGGTLRIDQTMVNARLLLLHFTVLDLKNKPLLEWEEFISACKN